MASPRVSGRSRRLSYRVSVCALLVMLVAGALWSSIRLTPRSRHAASRTVQESALPPVDPAYRRALKLGLAHNYRASYTEFRRLAQARRGTDTAAWSLYQAGLAARADRNPAGAEWAFTSLRRDFPRHRLTLRVPSGLRPVPQPSALPAADCGPRALFYVCQRLNVNATLSQLREAAGTAPDGTTLDGLAKAARGIGLKAEGLQVDRAALADLRHPAVAWVDGQHYVAVLATSDDRATIHDPNHSGEESIPIDNLLTRSGGVLLRLSR